MLSLCFKVGSSTSTTVAVPALTTSSPTSMELEERTAADVGADVEFSLMMELDVEVEAEAGALRGNGLKYRIPFIVMSYSVIKAGISNSFGLIML